MQRIGIASFCQVLSWQSPVEQRTVSRRQGVASTRSARHREGNERQGGAEQRDAGDWCSKVAHRNATHGNGVAPHCEMQQRYGEEESGSARRRQSVAMHGLLREALWRQCMVVQGGGDARHREAGQGWGGGISPQIACLRGWFDLGEVEML